MSLVFLFPFIQPSAQAASEQTAIEVLSTIPIQHGGRVKPFETFADEVVLFVTGKKTFEKKSASELLWRWMVFPEEWNQKPLIKVRYPALREELAVMLVNERLSPQLALNHAPLIDRAKTLLERRRANDSLTQEEKKILEIYDRGSLVGQIGLGAMPGWLPAKNLEDRWFSFRDLGALQATAKDSPYAVEQVKEIFLLLPELFKALKADMNSADSLEKAKAFRDMVRGMQAAREGAVNHKLIGMEVHYNSLDPFKWAWMAYLVALLFGLIYYYLSSVLQKPAKLFLWLDIPIYIVGFLLHTYGFYLRCVIAGRPPVSNMYESVIWVSWGTVLIAIILFLFYRAYAIRFYAGLAAILALIVAQGFPAQLDPFISPLVPVLRSNLWLTVHVLTITLSYAAFALAWAIGHGALFQFAFRPNSTELTNRMVLYLYRAIQIGVVLLAAGTVLGGVWANYSWGRFWGWDPKETWALIALLGYIVVLHGRFSGWLDAFGFTLGSVVAFLGILMAWYGVNYVLAAGLHSYGFGGGGAYYVGLVVLFDLLLVLGTAMKYKTVTSHKT